MTGYLYWESGMELVRLMATSGWNQRRCWPYPRWIGLAAIYMMLFPLRYPWDGAHRGDGLYSMKSTKEQGYLRWSPQWSHLHASDSIMPPLNGAHREFTLQLSTSYSFHWATSKLQFSLGYLQAAVFIGLPPDGVYIGGGPPWMESRQKRRTAAIDGMGICRTYCHRKFYHNMRPFYNIIWCNFCQFFLYDIPFLWETLPQSIWESTPCFTSLLAYSASSWNMRFLWFPSCVQKWLLWRNPSEPYSWLSNKILVLSSLFSVRSVLLGGQFFWTF